MFTLICNVIAHSSVVFILCISLIRSFTLAFHHLHRASLSSPSLLGRPLLVFHYSLKQIDIGISLISQFHLDWCCVGVQSAFQFFSSLHLNFSLCYVGGQYASVFISLLFGSTRLLLHWISFQSHQVVAALVDCFCIRTDCNLALFSCLCLIRLQFAAVFMFMLITLSSVTLQFWNRVSILLCSWITSNSIMISCYLLNHKLNSIPQGRHISFQYH
jgi:hypothetical protein